MNFPQINSGNIFLQSNTKCNNAGKVNFTGNADKISISNPCKDSFTSAEKSTADKIETELKAARAELTTLKRKFIPTGSEIKKIRHLEIYIEKLELYKKQNEIHPKTAFLYDPDTSDCKKIKQAEGTNGVSSLEWLAHKYSCDPEIIGEFIRNGNLVADEANQINFKRFFIDEDFEPNRKLLATLEERRGSLVGAGQFINEYNFSQSKLERLIKNGEIKPFMAEQARGFRFFIDVEDEKNKKTIEEHKKTTPVPSKRYYASSMSYSENVPVVKLEKLGFENARTLAGMIKAGALTGEYKEYMDENGKRRIRASVDINSKQNEQILENLRRKNPSTPDFKDFAAQAGIKLSEVKEALLAEELEIIPEYIFEFDHNKAFIDLKNAKNRDFLEQKILEKEMRAELTVQKKKERCTTLGLVTKLAWSYCDKTKSACKRFVAMNPEIIEIFAKIENEGKNSITEEEEKALKIFYKCVWKEAGSEEFKEKMGLAKEEVKKYQSGKKEELSSETIDFIENYLNKNQE